MRYASLLALSLLAACNRSPKPSPEVPKTPSTEAPSAETADVGAKDEAPPAQKLSVAEANNAFALDLYSKLYEKPGNLAFSPASIMAALAMTYGGAEGETQAAMAKVLHLDSAREGAGFEVGEAFDRMTKNSPGLTLRVANRLFGDKSFSFSKDYLQKTEAAFGAPLEALDFQKATEASRVTINEWVAKQTERKIENLIPQGGVNADTRLVLTNAIYFLGKWSAPFEKEATSPKPFHLAGEKTKEVPMMHQTGHHLYGEADGVKVLEMSYRESEFAMSFVLPKAGEELSKLEASLSPSLLASWVDSLEPHRTEVKLPKFRIEPADGLALGTLLRQLGMEQAFDSAKADFSKMMDSEKASERLAMSEVFHKAFVLVDEAGTEAAAATAVMVRQTSAIIEDMNKEFHADRPFLFFLRHKPTGSVLFMGKVVDPS